MTWSGRRSFAGIVVCAALGVVASPAAASGGGGTPLPHVTGPLPVTATSYPFGAADHTLVPEDLRKVGYVEEEYLVSGKANVYTWPAPGPAVVRTPNAPYTTRILVRRPAKASRFSGNVVVEMLNPSNLFDLNIGWAMAHRQMVRQRRRLGRHHRQADRRAGAEEVRPGALRLAVVRQPAGARRPGQLPEPGDLRRPVGPFAQHRGRPGLGHLQPGRRAGAQPRPRQPAGLRRQPPRLVARAPGHREARLRLRLLADRRVPLRLHQRHPPARRAAQRRAPDLRRLHRGRRRRRLRGHRADQPVRAGPPSARPAPTSSPTSACRSSTSCRSRTTCSASPPGGPTATRRPTASATTRWPAPPTPRRTS